MAESTPDDHRSTADSLVYSDADKSLASLRSSLLTFADSREFPLSSAEVKEDISKISDWVDQQKKGSNEKTKKELVQNMGKVAASTVSGILKIESGDSLGGTLEIISGVAMFTGELIGGPIGAAVGAIIGTICNIIGAIFAARKPKQPSIVEQVAEVVHKELVEFNSKLQDQKYDGLKRRVSDQIAQLQKMKSGKLDDPDLWNYYVQFMGELGNRIRVPLPCKNELYELSDNLTKEPEVADFVRALATYCQAYGCFNALLITAKGIFARLGETYRELDEVVDRKISCQKKDLKDTLSFLFNKNYLTLLGRLPPEGGKLIKIVAFSRNPEVRSIVKMTTHGLGFPELLDYKTVEVQAEIAAHQSVNLKLRQLEFPVGLTLEFVNETSYPLKVICDEKSRHRREIKTLEPRKSCYIRSETYLFGGYVVIYLDRKVRPDVNPHEPDVTHIIEFATSLRDKKVNIQDKTHGEFTEGRNTYDKIKSDGAPRKSIYWKTKRGVYCIASAECTFFSVFRCYARFIFQKFNPIRDVVAAPKKT